jgi:hypothetical protein
MAANQEPGYPPSAAQPGRSRLGLVQHPAPSYAFHALRSPAAILGLICFALLSLASAQQFDPAQSSYDRDAHERLRAIAGDWLRGKDRQAFPCKVQLMPVHLTYQQRFLEEIRVTIKASALEGGQPRDLHFLLKLADAEGRWYDGDEYNHFRVPANLANDNEARFGAGLYLKPGHYTIAILVYDSVAGEGNLWRKQINIAPPKHDALPGLDRDVRAVEYIANYPDANLSATSRRAGWTGNEANPRVHNPPRWNDPAPGVPVVPMPTPPVVNATWDLPHGRDSLPVHSSQPLNVDVVLDFSEENSPDLKHAESAAEFQQKAGRLLQIGRLLSRMKTGGGSVRVFAIESSRMRILFGPLNAEGLRWDPLQHTIRTVDNNTLSIAELEQRNGVPVFLHDFLSGLITAPGSCEADGKAAAHAVIYIPAVNPQAEAASGFDGGNAQCRAHAYYIRPEGWSSSRGNLEKALQPLGVRSYGAASPEDFRKSLGRLLDDLATDSVVTAAKR